MTPDEAAKAIEDILERETTKMDKAMLLYELGLSRTEAAELVPMNYSQAHTAWTRYYNGSGRSTPAPRVRAHQARVPVLRENDEGGHRRPTRNRALFLTPTQTRYITQDGHKVVRVDKPTGSECHTCGARVQFSLKWLGFVHTFSKNEPTDVEDRYDD